MSAPEACDELIDRSCAPHLLTEMRAPVVGSGLIAFVAEVAATTMRDAEQIVQFLADRGAQLDAKTRAEGWTPLRVADGVYYTGTVKRGRDAGALLRKLLRDRGLPVPEFTDDVDYGDIHPPERQATAR